MSRYRRKCFFTGIKIGFTAFAYIFEHLSGFFALIGIILAKIQAKKFFFRL